MKKLQPPDSHHLQAAIGWLELGNHLEANEELELITPALRVHSDVLGIRWEIFAKEKKWVACIEIAAAVIKLAPNRANGWIQRSYALHELKRTQEALELLLPATEKFPKNSTIPYNLACYETQLGNLKAAWQWLARAFDIGDAKAIKLQALEDPDLEKLWMEIAEI